MKKSAYITPTMETIKIQTRQTLLLVSGTGKATETPGGLDYDGVGGSFGSDESVAARELLWDDDE
ncbi:MAG: hypothetical protein IJ527_06065 [Prevotella sp.]|nr:hypothetical protein [Prevotella sp.]